MLITANFDYNKPSDIDEAVKLLKNDGGLIIAGGSDVMPQLKCATISPAYLIDLGGIDALKSIKECEDGIHIGAMAVLSHIAKDPIVTEKLPALSQAARNVASPQIRNRGTIGGNILQARRCFYYNQSKEWRRGIAKCYKVGGNVCLQIPNSPVCRALYYSDVAPVLLAYEARAVVYVDRTKQEISVKDLVDAHCEDRLGKVLIAEFIIPAEQYKYAFSYFVKYSLTGSIDFPIINFAGVYANKHVKLYVGAISTHVIELAETQAYIENNGKDFSVDECLKVAMDEMKRKDKVIRESGISIQVKRSTFHYVETLLAQLKANM